MASTTPVSKGSKILRCSCKHEYQDSKYGVGMRVCNHTRKEGGEGYRCTVCGAIIKHGGESKKEKKETAIYVAAKEGTKKEGKK